MVRHDISDPVQGTRGLPLVNVAVKGNAVSFAMKGAPGDPSYTGTLAADGKMINGTFSQGGGSVPLNLAWKGEPKFEIPKKSTPITKDLEGSWEGALDIQGKVLRLVLKLANGPEGATGTMVSLDQRWRRVSHRDDHAGGTQGHAAHHDDQRHVRG